MATDNLRAALCIILAMVCYVINDALIKAVGEVVAWHQALLLRSVAAGAFLLLAAWALGHRPGPRAIFGLLRYRPVSLRVGLETLAMSCWVAALVHLPLSAAVAVNQLLPVFLMIGGVLVYRERPGPHRLSAAAVSIVGVLLIVKPGSEAFTSYALLCALATALMAARDVATRSIPPSLSAVNVSLLAMFVIICFAAIASAGTPWPPLPMSAIWSTLGAGLSISLAFVLTITGVRLGEVSFLAPFRYAALVAGLIVAYLAFGERPDALSLVGAAIIILAGIHLMARERRAQALARKST